MSKPSITISIPTYNRADLLPKALDSALSQTFTDIEIVVCDDGSTDGTAELLKKYDDPRLRSVIQERNKGMFNNMNECINSAMAERFLLLMDDDFLEPEALEILDEPWKREPELSFSYGRYMVHKGDDTRLMSSEGPELEDGFEFCRQWFLDRRAVLSNAVLFRTEAVRSIGGFPKMFAFDHYVILNSAMKGKVAFTSRLVSHYLDHPATATNALDMKTIVRDKDLLLESFLAEGRRRSIPKKQLDEVRRTVRKRTGFDTAASLASFVDRGGGRLSALGKAWSAKWILARNPVFSAGSIALCAFAPRGLIRRMRARSRARRGLPEPD